MRPMEYRRREGSSRVVATLPTLDGGLRKPAGPGLFLLPFTGVPLGAECSVRTHAPGCRMARHFEALACIDNVGAIHLDD
jgi:hypothetical protein